MKFGWFLILLRVSLSEECLGSKNEESKIARRKTPESIIKQGIWNNAPSKAAVKLRNQRKRLNNTDHNTAKESLLTAVRRSTEGNEGDANVKQPSKLEEVPGKVKEVPGKEVKVSQDKKVSFTGIFLKLMTRGLLKKIALPAIVRFGLLFSQRFLVDILTRN